MGKAAKFKKLRKLASQLPAINTYRPLGSIVSGKDLIGKEKDSNGDPINPRIKYQQVESVQVPLNHNRKLKQAYKKAGMQGAAQYANAVYQYTKNLQK